MIPQKFLHLHCTNDKMMDPVNSQKISSCDHEAERSLSNRKNCKSIFPMTHRLRDYSQQTLRKYTNKVIPCRFSIDSMSRSDSRLK